MIIREYTINKIKWWATALLLVGVSLNILNNPELQEYVYPYNLYLNSVGCVGLFACAVLQGDRPYMALNGILGLGYLIGVFNVFYPLGG